MAPFILTKLSNKPDYVSLRLEIEDEKTKLRYYPIYVEFQDSFIYLNGVRKNNWLEARAEIIRGFSLYKETAKGEQASWRSLALVLIELHDEHKKVFENAKKQHVEPTPINPKDIENYGIF